MQRHSRLAAAALAGIVAVGSLAATVATGAPALADDHRSGWNDRHDARDHGPDRDDHRNANRDDRRTRRRTGTSTWAAPAGASASACRPKPQRRDRRRPRMAGAVVLYLGACVPLLSPSRLLR